MLYEIFFTAFQHTPYVKQLAAYYSSSPRLQALPLHRLCRQSYVKQDFAISLESSTSFTWTLLCLFAPWGIEHHPHTRLSSGA